MKRTLALLVLYYFRSLAKIQLKKNNPIIIGITGSAGKTSALQACEAVLQDHFSLKVSHKANSESGIPLDILGLHPTNFSVLNWIVLAVQAPLQLLLHWPKYQIYLVEMGIDSPDEPKNMSYLLKIMTPTVGILLNAGPVHAAMFDHLISEKDSEKRRRALIQLIANEKGKLLQAIPKSGFAIANADDEPVLLQLRKARAHQISFGKSKQSDVKINSVEWSKNSTLFHLKYKDIAVKIEINEQILPELYSYSFAAGIACGISMGLDAKQAAESIEKNMNIPPGRSSLIPAHNGATIVDSTYNASTGPMIDMLRLLKKVPGKRKLALLGDMRELGEVTAHEHMLVALEAANICDMVFLVGPLTKEHLMPVLIRKKIPVEWYATAYDAAQAIKPKLKKDDVLLVKGSQNTLLLEIAVEKLMADPTKANELLCRRGAYWDQRRKAIEPL